MIYIDTSSLLKLLFNEHESGAVRQAIAAEREVRVSSLTRLEAQVQLKAGCLGGDYGKTKYRAYLKQLEAFGDMDPFHFVSLSGGVFETAMQQDSGSPKDHLRTLDRLHLAALGELGISRLMTNDSRQAESALSAGYEAVVPHG
ncbi:MAG TPA: PIN domain-containing protein [Planctomycetes bacterium]|nr:PIN domain-containing protein [Planctomycetota bacterium]